MGITKLVAWWGAVLSTIVFLWDIYKYRKAGPRLRFRVRGGMTLVPSTDKRTFVSSEVTNYGDRPTTITNLCVAYFKKPLSFARLRKRATINAVVKNPLGGPALPFKLEPGNVWQGLAEQTPELEKWGREGLLYFELYHSHHTKPVRQRVRFKQEPPAPGSAT
ncbi:MAG: hypothetical protein WB992_10860 [Bryobacteraceae bacterium]